MDPALSTSLVVFAIDGHRFALPLQSVEQVVRMVELTPLPGAPAVIAGAVNVRGRIVPVADPRLRLAMARREAEPDSMIIIARARSFTIGIIADDSSGVVEAPAGDLLKPEEVLPGLVSLEGLLKLKDGMLVIHDMDAFLSADEEAALAGAMKVFRDAAVRDA